MNIYYHHHHHHHQAKEKKSSTNPHIQKRKSLMNLPKMNSRVKPLTIKVIHKQTKFLIKQKANFVNYEHHYHCHQANFLTKQKAKCMNSYYYHHLHQAQNKKKTPPTHSSLQKKQKKQKNKSPT